MGISPWYVGQTLPVWKITLQQVADDGTKTFLDLTGATLVLMVANANAPTTFSPAVNTPSIVTPASNGILQYLPAVTDQFVTTAGHYTLRWEATYSNGVTKTDYMQLTTQP